MAAGSEKTVVTTLASTKNTIKNGNILLRSNVPAAVAEPSPAAVARLA